MLSAKLAKIGLPWLALSAGVFLSLGLVAASARAQSQTDNASVADAARRAREQKKNAPKPVRTITNDDLPAAPSAAAPSSNSDDDQQPKPDGQAAAPDTAAAPRESAARTEDAGRKKAEIEAKLKQAKADLAQAQSELDVLQRKTALDSDSFYSKTGFASDTEGKALLDADAQQLNDKKSQVSDLQTKIAALQAQLDKPAEPALR